MMTALRWFIAWCVAFVLACSTPGCAQAVKVASVLEPVARVSCGIARKVVAACELAFPDTVEGETCPTAGDEITAASAAEGARE